MYSDFIRSFLVIMLLRKRPERDELSKKLPIRKSKMKKENSQENNYSKKLDMNKEPLSPGNGTKCVENQDEGEDLELSSDENKPKKKRRRRVLSWSHKKRKKYVYTNEEKTLPLYTGPVECSLIDVLETLNTLTDEEKQLPSECSLIYECKKCSEFFRDFEEFFKHKTESCSSVEESPTALKTDPLVAESIYENIENIEFSDSNNIAEEIRSRLRSLKDSDLFFGPIRKRRKIINHEMTELLNLAENDDPTSPSTSGISKSA